jgi:hypothetical protein
MDAGLRAGERALGNTITSAGYDRQHALMSAIRAELPPLAMQRVPAIARAPLLASALESSVLGL